MITKKFDELFDKYKNSNYISERRIKLKLKEITACHEECTLEEQEFTNEIIDKFCELIALLEERNEEERQALIFKYDALGTLSSGNVENFVASPNEHLRYSTGEELLTDFYNYFIKVKTESTMKDYVARVNTFAYSGKYLYEMLESGTLGVKTFDCDPILFTYQNIELIIAKFNTKDENGNSIKQRLNIRSALRMLNEFKKYKESC